VVAAREAIRLRIEIMVPIAILLMLFFLLLEVPQMIEMGRDYILDTWNMIDMTIVYLNMVFLIMLMSDVILE
jgi:hypothetical protein|tara:strand:+ start:926 stop:1141 length:216 start_codon:yes stop_codon:yes gene_type:complete